MSERNDKAMASQRDTTYSSRMENEQEIALKGWAPSNGGRILPVRTIRIRFANNEIVATRTISKRQ